MMEHNEILLTINCAKIFVVVFYIIYISVLVPVDDN